MVGHSHGHSCAAVHLRRSKLVNKSRQGSEPDEYDENMGIVCEGYSELSSFGCIHLNSPLDAAIAASLPCYR